MRVSRTLPNVPCMVASSCASDNCAHASSKRWFAQRLYVKKSVSRVVMAKISFCYHGIPFPSALFLWHSQQQHRAQQLLVRFLLRDTQADGITNDEACFQGKRKTGWS